MNKKLSDNINKSLYSEEHEQVLLNNTEDVSNLSEEV